MEGIFFATYMMGQKLSKAGDKVTKNNKKEENFHC